MKFKLLKASRYFIVFPYTPEAIKLCMMFQHRYIHKVFSINDDTPSKLFSSALHDNSEFRFHRNTLKNFMVFIKENRFSDDEFVMEDKPLPVVKHRKIKVKKEWVVREEQEPIVDYLKAASPVNKFIGIQTGKGKATSLNELIKIPHGWKKMGDIQVGDDVIAKDGSTTKVTGVYPQGKLQLYRVTFSDGRHVDCCAEHLWRVYTDQISKVVDTQEIIYLLSLQKSHVFIDLCDPEDCDDVSLPVAPYLLGTSLVYALNGEFIPNIYFHASKQQRLSLLQGILDIGGSIELSQIGGTVKYCTFNYQLVKGIQYLVRSLGGLASIRIRNGSRITYEVFIKHKGLSELFTLPEKKEQIFADGCQVNDLKLRVMSVEPKAIEEAQCISIDHPDRLYVTTDFVVTHNTFCSLYGVAELGYRTIVIVEGGLVSKWASDILKVLDIKAKRTLCVRGGKQLRGLIAMADNKEFDDIDVILLSSSTLQDWITLYEVMVTSSSKSRDIGYGIDPGDLYEKLKIGHRLIDEVHKKFHFNYKQDLYTNTHLVTSLSATLFSYDKAMEGFYEIAYPMQERYKAGKIDKYAQSTAVLWTMQRGRKVRTKENGRSTYSHTAFENSLMKSKEMMSNYFEMISETIDLGYIKNYKPGNKVAIYVATIDMATRLTEYLKRRFVGKTVERYVGSMGDAYANLLDPDLRVTTLGSGGTGHDIHGLTDTILTVAIMSLQANIQVFGRLRFIPDQETRFYYFNCRDVEQHMKYHQLKMPLMNERAKSFDIIEYYTPI